MKKLFMIAASVSLAMGVVGCQKGPDNGPNGGNGSETAMGLSITLPNAGGKTRAELAPVEGSAAESAVKTMDLFVFDSNGNAPAETEKAYKRWTNIAGGADFTKGATPQTANTYTLKNPFTTIAGDVRVWIGINLPGTGYSSITSETDLKAKFATVASMSDATTNGLIMFSNGASQNLAVLPLVDPPADGLTANTVKVDVYRAVAKVIATKPGSIVPANWRITWTDFNATAHLQYTPVHWRIFQHATSSYVAPNYDVPTYNNTVAPADRPKTYAPTVANTISTYAVDAVMDTQLTMGEDPGAGNESSLNTLGGSVYVGENSGSNGGNTTFAFVTTTIKPTFEATWDSATENLKWAAVAAYGNSAGDAAKRNVYFIRYQDKEYITSTQANYDAIVNGLAAKLKYTLDATNSTALPTKVGEYTTINAKDFPAAIGLECYIYWDGYVHFPYYFNKAEANRYDLLRNQFVHLRVTGLNNNANSFPGYPGQNPSKTDYLLGDPAVATTGVSSIPSDPTDAYNNPYIVDPTKPLDAQSTVMLVEVAVRPWHYKVEEVKLNQ